MKSIKYFIVYFIVAPLQIPIYRVVLKKYSIIGTGFQEAHFLLRHSGVAVNSTKFSCDTLPHLSIILRNVIISKQTLLKTSVAAGTVLPSEQYNMALTIVAMVPILVLYPFVQKYFVAGVMIGAVKE